MWRNKYVPFSKNMYNLHSSYKAVIRLDHVLVYVQINDSKAFAKDSRSSTLNKYIMNNSTDI